MREIVAVPVLGEGLSVVRDGTIGAHKQLEVGAYSHGGGLPGFAARMRACTAAPHAADAVAAQSCLQRGCGDLPKPRAWAAVMSTPHSWAISTAAMTHAW